jgi:hypothetical protein
VRSQQPHSSRSHLYSASSRDKQHSTTAHQSSTLRHAARSLLYTPPFLLFSIDWKFIGAPEFPAQAEVSAALSSAAASASVQAARSEIAVPSLHRFGAQHGTVRQASVLAAAAVCVGAIADAPPCVRLNK